MQETPGSVVRLNISLDPAFYITGHRGAASLWVIADTEVAAVLACDLHHKLGYRHLKVHPLLLGDPIDWQPWMATTLTGGTLHG